MRNPKIAGGVGAAFTRDGAPADAVGVIRLDRGLRSGRLDMVWVDELELARIVADGAGMLARLAGERRLAEVRQMGQAS